MRRKFAQVVTALVKFLFTLKSLILSIFWKSKARRKVKALNASNAKVERLFAELCDTRNAATRRLVVFELTETFKAATDTKYKYKMTTHRSNSKRVGHLLDLAVKRYYSNKR